MHLFRSNISSWNITNQNQEQHQHQQQFRFAFSIFDDVLIVSYLIFGFVLFCVIRSNRTTKEAKSLQITDLKFSHHSEIFLHSIAFIPFIVIIVCYFKSLITPTDLFINHKILYFISFQLFPSTFQIAECVYLKVKFPYLNHHWKGKVKSVEHFE